MQSERLSFTIVHFLTLLVIISTFSLILVSGPPAAGSIAGLFSLLLRPVLVTSAVLGLLTWAMGTIFAAWIAIIVPALGGDYRYTAGGDLIYLDGMLNTWTAAQFAIAMAVGAIVAFFGPKLLLRRNAI